MLLKASSNKCSINCVQFGDKSKYCSSMMRNLSFETGGDVVDPTQIQWLSHYFRRQNAIGKVIDWRSLPENKKASDTEVGERIQLELSNCTIEDCKEQEQVEEEVLNYDITESRDEDHACQSASAIKSQESDFPSARQPVLKPGDKVGKGLDWNDAQNTEDCRCERGTVINYNQKQRIVKVKWDNGTEDYYQEGQILLQQDTDHQQKPR
ncbi:uncharacterized protein LOC110454461 [Mizuhopecten yessoensis]|uniref:uncharacterized protein LOC110454461 n=1 Tax=Mizuhopecten yessoensis TaxID=6573 RepID=UPI000B45A31D|nr:uncharacterized protein LOC110454461 [Mizuhopecten yessoensis]